MQRLILIIAMLPLFVFAQNSKSNWEKDKLKGKVQSVETFDCDISFNRNGDIVKRLNGKVSHTKSHYDSLGNCIRYEFYSGDSLQSFNSYIYG